MKKHTIYKSLLLICLLLNILQLPAQTTGVMDLCELGKQPIYVLGDKRIYGNWEYALRFYVNNNSVLSYGGKTITLSLQDLNTMANKDSVYRLTVYKDAYMNIPVSLLDFPNLQELNLIDCSLIPKNLDIFKKLQILKIWGSDFRQVGIICNNNSKQYNFDYVDAPSFPKGIVNLRELRILIFSPHWGYTVAMPMPDLSQLPYLNYIELDNLYSKEAYRLPHISFLLNKNVQSTGLNMVFSKNLPDCINKEELGKPFKSSGKYANAFYNERYIELLQPQRIEVVGELRKGVAHGKYLVYINGKLTQERFYNKGIEVGVWTLWDSTQVKKDNNSHTHTQYFFTKGLVDSIINYYSFYDEDSLPKFKEIIQSTNNDYTNRISSFVDSNGRTYGQREYKNNALAYTWDYSSTYINKMYKHIYDGDIEIYELYDANNVLLEKGVKDGSKYTIYHYNENGEIIETKYD